MLNTVKYEEILGIQIFHLKIGLIITITSIMHNI